jgi:sec-independent protein translocase protein TatA
MGSIGFPELLLILLIALLVFGGKRLPEMARGLGAGIRDFKRALQDDAEGPKFDGKGM